MELVPTYPDGYWDQVKYAFLGAAIPEECAKLFVLWFFLRRCRHFDKGRGAGYIFLGLLLAILAHGLFDFLLGIMNYGWAFIVMFAFFGIFFYLHKWGSDHIREALERDKGKS